MLILLRSLLIIGLVSSTLYAQKTECTNTKENKEIKLTKEFLSATKQDLEQARLEGLNAFKILPRNEFSFKKNSLNIRGGGAYYSFSTKSHNYNDIPQLELQMGRLQVGFYGASYGFISNLGEVSIESVKHTAEADFLLKYQIPKFIKEIRSEKRKARDYQVNGMNFKRQVSAILGNTYILRAISFREADKLIAFKIHRQDEDGSLIIFWKSIKDFDVPLIQKVQISNSN